MKFSCTKTMLLVTLMLSLVPMSVGCSQVENIAMGLENDIENTTTATTEDTTTEAITERLHYDPTLTMSIYEPTEITTEYTESTTEDKDIITTTTTPLEDITTTSILESYCTGTSTTTEATTETAITSTESPSYTTVDSSYLFNDCAFIGDSLTVGLSMYGYIPDDYTFAQEGISLLKINSLQLSTTCGYVYPAQAVADWNSKHVYILLGINGVTWISTDTAISRYTQLINDILAYCPNVEDVNIISVFPVAYSMETKSSVEDGRILNSEVDAFNARLQAMASQLGVNYIDVNSKLKNNYGCLPDNLTVDGLHLTQLGYEIVRDTLLDNVQ